MNKKELLLIAAAAFMLSLLISSNNLRAQDMDGVKKMFENKCSQCHALSRPLKKKKSLDGWKITNQRMAKKNGSGISPQEADKIAEYLYSLKKMQKQNNR